MGNSDSQSEVQEGEENLDTPEPKDHVCDPTIIDPRLSPIHLQMTPYAAQSKRKSQDSKDNWIHVGDDVSLALSIGEWDTSSKC